MGSTGLAAVAAMGVVATVVAATVGMSVLPVAAATADDLAITVPDGLVVEDLAKPGLDGDILISGCAAGDSIVDLSYRALDRDDDPGPSLTDLTLIADDDGVTRLPVETVSAWFVSVPRPPGGEIEITVECDAAGDRTFGLATIASMPLSVVVPAGVTVGTLRVSEASSVVTINGCTGGAVSARFAYVYPLGPGVPEASTPILLVPPVEAVDSSVAIPLTAVGVWLRENAPDATEGERIVVDAQCVGRDRAEGIIPSDLSVAPEIPGVDPFPNPEPLPGAGPVAGGAGGSSPQGRPLPATG
ncbi:hypothetical protein V6S02_16250 [Microbacterium sp. CCNWLW134]|uniref:hypothetical protein n=1 Tax=Microbacterium sp. CCNWLW134 TaxID=3122064 RepID=UPI00300FEF9B